MEAIIVMDTLHWITPRCSSHTSASVLSHSVNVKMENCKIACNTVWPQFLDLWNANIGHGRLNRIDGIDRLAAKHCHWWLITSRMILSVEVLEKPEATAKYISQFRRRKGHCLIIYSVCPTGTTVNRISGLLPLQHLRHCETWGRGLWTFLDT